MLATTDDSWVVQAGLTKCLVRDAFVPLRSAKRDLSDLASALTVTQEGAPDRKRSAHTCLAGQSPQRVNCAPGAPLYARLVRSW